MSFLCLKLFNMFPSPTGSRSSSLIWHLKLCNMYFQDISCYSLICHLFPHLHPMIWAQQSLSTQHVLLPQSVFSHVVSSIWSSFPGVSQGELSSSLFMHRTLFHHFSHKMFSDYELSGCALKISSQDKQDKHCLKK